MAWVAGLGSTRHVEPLALVVELHPPLPGVLAVADARVPTVLAALLRGSDPTIHLERHGERVEDATKGEQENNWHYMECRRYFLTLYRRGRRN